MDGYIREVENLEYAFAENNVLYEDLKKQFNEIKENLGDEEATKFLQEKVTPVGHQESIIFSNLRYFALTAFSLKRYVMASQFSLIKAQSLVNKNDETFKDFMAIYDRIILKIEDRIFNFLVQNDI